MLVSTRSTEALSFQVPSQPEDILDRVELTRLAVAKRLDPDRKASLGQFFTPMPVARLMASMFSFAEDHISLLDAGAGIGSLSAACIAELCARPQRPKTIHITAYEIEPTLAGPLAETMRLCREACEACGIEFSSEVRQGDFIQDAVAMLLGSLTHPVKHPRPNCSILNPPYAKIHSRSPHRQQLRRLGIETGNLYTGFLAIANQLLSKQGELVAITPRSFCNGPYFRPFRKSLLNTMALQRVHVFESRQQAFRDDAVLQENIILHAVKLAPQPERVTISGSSGPEDHGVSMHDVAFVEVVQPNDPQSFIHLMPDDLARRVTARLALFQTTLQDLGLSVSTGRVVAFRAREFLQAQPDAQTVPLIYPLHLRSGLVEWPQPAARKPNALVLNAKTRNLTVPNGHYVLVKRFSAKEELKRIVAAVHDPAHVPGDSVGFENHLNYFHCHNNGLDPVLAKGLAAYLNTSLVDTYFRQFNGHTQVNATDLRSLPYPTEVQLRALGEQIGETFPSQIDLDALIEKELIAMAEPTDTDPIRTAQRVNEARQILKDLGLPRAQQNERSALTLLALLDLTPEMNWSEAQAPPRGITQMMGFFSERYGKTYAPNTRETVRRQTVHQFRDAGLILENPDAPARPVNSGKTVYQLERSALELLRTFGTEEWETNLRAYLASVVTLQERYRQEREMVRIPIQIDAEQTITLSPGGQNILIEQIVDEFASRFTPSGRLLYIGDADEKFAHFDQEAFTALGVTIGAHGKMPDVIIHHTEKDWLVLVEAVTSHGPINPKRYQELKQLFGSSRAGLVFVTSFLTRRAMVEYLPEISWETDVWVAESPDHLIHFNGERFLGPY